MEARGTGGEEVEDGMQNLESRTQDTAYLTFTDLGVGGGGGLAWRGKLKEPLAFK